MSLEAKIIDALARRGISPSGGDANGTVAADDEARFVDLYFCFFSSPCGGRAQVHVDGPSPERRAEISPAAKLTHEGTYSRFFEVEARAEHERTISAFTLHQGASRYTSNFLHRPPEENDCCPAEFREIVSFDLLNKIELLGDWLPPAEASTALFQKQARDFVREAAEDHHRRMTKTLPDFADARGSTFSPNHIETMWRWNYLDYQHFAAVHQGLTAEAINYSFRRMRDEQSRSGDYRTAANSDGAESGSCTDTRLAEPPIKGETDAGNRDDG